MKLITVTAALQIVAMCEQSYAESLPWVQHLASGNPITIPAGKILIIEQVSNNTSAQTSAEFVITGQAVGGVGSGPFTAVTRMQLAGFDLQKMPTPLRVGPGMTFTCGLPVGGVTMFGTVIDSSDFIAAADPVVKGSLLRGGVLASTIDSGTSKPTTIVGEASNDLTAWSKTGVTIAKSSSNPRVSKIVTPADAPKKFVRARLTTHAVQND